MTPGTAYNQRRFCVRYEQFARSSPGPLAPTVQRFLTSLPPSQQSAAKTALKRHLGRLTLDWEGLAVARYRRNAANLKASVLREDHRAALRAVADGPRELALIECLWTLRRTEVAALRWPDLDLGRAMVTVHHGKGDKPDATLLTPDAVAALTAWRDASTAGGTAIGPVFHIPPGHGQPRYIGLPYTPTGLGRWVQRILERAGLWHPGLGSAHRFRRTMATEYLRENKEDLKGLQAIMRHENIATTAKYVWLTTDDLAPRLARVRL